MTLPQAIPVSFDSTMQAMHHASEVVAQQALAELRESEARFRAIFDNAAVGIALMSLDRHILHINQTVERITGYSEAEMQMINPSDLIIEADRHLDRELFQELIAGQRNQYLSEKRYLGKDGRLFWGRVNFSLVRGAASEPLYIIGLIEDITEAKRAQEAVVSERTRLARDLHDAVTQTLFSATLIADVVPDLWDMDQSEARRRLEELRQLTRGALAEMRTLLVELRPNALVEVPLPTLLRQLTESLTARARLNIQLHVEGEHKLPADAQIALYRIAQEALNNVAKHAKATQALVTLRLNGAARISVTDNGIGFDPEQFQPNHLGLKIMRERADAIGAKLTVDSEPGEGTQVTVVWADREAA